MCGKNERGYIPKVVATAGGKGHVAGEASCFTRPLGAAPNKLLSSLARGTPLESLTERTEPGKTASQSEGRMETRSWVTGDR